MKRFLSLFLVVAALLCINCNAELLEEDTSFIDSSDFYTWVVPASTTALNPTAQGAILIEAETGKVLFEKNPDEKLPIASVTKVMTLLLTMEALDGGVITLDDMVTVSENAASMGGSQAWMEPGENLSVHEMLKAVVVSSCNDGAVALAEHLAGSEGEFVARMNEKAKELGMTNTEFINCTGLDDDAVHYSTARDVALMSRELLKHEKIFDYTTIWMDTIRNGAFGLNNTNKLIRFYSGANGLKTGSTSKAKFCLSASAKRADMQLIAVVLGSPSGAERFADAKSLLDFGFANYAIYIPSKLSMDRVKVRGGKEDFVGVNYTQTPLVVKKGVENKIEARVDIAKSLSAPVERGQTIGHVSFVSDGEEIAKVPIYAKTGVEKAGVLDIFTTLISSLFSIK